MNAVKLANTVAGQMIREGVWGGVMVAATGILFENERSARHLFDTVRKADCEIVAISFEPTGGVLKARGWKWRVMVA